MPMRKMISIVFLLLVLIISLGVSVYMNAILKEGLDNETEGEASAETEEEASTETEGGASTETEGGASAETEGETSPVDEEESSLDITPMEGSCTETMTNYR